MANFVLGSGRVFVGTSAGQEVLVAETPELSYSAKATTQKEYTNDGPTAEVAAAAPTQIERSGKFTCKDVAAYNLALWNMGASSTVSTTTGAVTADPINGGAALVGDRYYQLGLAAAPRVGVRGISALALKTGETAYTAGSDYVASATDLALGRVYIPTGSTAIGHVVTADYTRPTASREQVASGNSPITGTLRFIADNTVGRNTDYLFTQVTIYPSGDLSLKSRTKFHELGFEFEIQKPATGAAVYIDGRPE